MAKTVIQLVFLSLVAGLLLSWFGVTPVNFWNSVGDLAVTAWASGVDFFGWAWDYIIIGGAVIVPIYVVRRLLGGWRKKPANSPSEETQE